MRPSNNGTLLAALRAAGEPGRSTCEADFTEQYWMGVVRRWVMLYWSLWAAVGLTAALNVLHVRAGFLTNHAADLVVPALLYVMIRGLAERDHHQPRLLRRWFGGTPERAALVVFLASTGTELSQRYWPTGVFPGRYDPLDIAAFGAGVAVCYACDKWGSVSRTGAAH